MLKIESGSLMFFQNLVLHSPELMDIYKHLMLIP